MLGPLVDEAGACGRGDRGEGLAVVAHLDVEVAGVGLRLFASCTGVLHDEARHRANRTEIHLQEQGPLVSAPLIGLASRHAAVHGFFRPLILAARLTAGGGAIEREVLLAFRPIDLEFVNPRNRLSAVGRPTDIQTDETGIDRRLDDVGGRPCVGGALADAACLCRRVFLGRLSQPLLDVLRGLSLADAVHEGRTNHTALASAGRSATSHRDRARRRWPRAGARAHRPRASAWRRRLGAARSSQSSTPAWPRPTKELEAFMTTHRRSDTRRAHRRSRRPAPHSQSCGRRARSVRAPARTAPGHESSPASRACHRAA